MLSFVTGGLKHAFVYVGRQYCANDTLVIRSNTEQATKINPLNINSKLIHF